MSDSEAAAVAQAEEEARERTKDEHEAELLSADIVKTTRLRTGDRTIVFNQVRLSGSAGEEAGNQPVESTGFDIIADRSPGSPEREHVDILLFGVVDEFGISALSWSHGGRQYRMFANADFSLLGSMVFFEDSEATYSAFILVTPAPAFDAFGADAWRPTPADFSMDPLEYFVVDGEENPAAYRGIEAMLLHYSDNEVALRIAHSNAEKLRRAREAYLKENPPKKRHIILNYSRN